MDNRVVYAVLVLFFNQLGIVSFLNGNVKKGVFTIISAIITCNIIGLINAIKGIILAIKLFQMSDEAFAAADKATLEDTIVLFYKD